MRSNLYILLLYRYHTYIASVLKRYKLKVFGKTVNSVFIKFTGLISYKINKAGEHFWWYIFQVDIKLTIS